MLMALMARMRNLQSRQRSSQVAQEHYDTTIAPYRNMSDKWITLSCGYWKNARNLDEAQEAKLDLVCRKIGLSNGDRVLDIGCGFGSFARFAAERYGCSVTGINLSAEQIRVARELAGGLPVQIVQCDYREHGPVPGRSSFRQDRLDRHVRARGIQELPRLLRGRQPLPRRRWPVPPAHHRVERVAGHYNDPWYDKYIFPNGMLPSIQQIGGAIEGLFVMEDWHNFGVDYALTHQAWYERFDATWEGSKSDSFYRMWKYFLLSSVGGFKARHKQLWQIVLSKGGVRPRYERVT